MKKATREEMMDLLRAKFPRLFMKTTEEFKSDYKGGIWSGAEDDGLIAKDGHKLLNYYAEDYQEKRYVFGVHREIGDFLEGHGWYAEWYDCGTIMFWII